MLSWTVFVVFFFQAEDGIRDVAVTGVQTCALPISLDRALPRLRRFLRRPHREALARGGTHALPQGSGPGARSSRGGSPQDRGTGPRSPTRRTRDRAVPGDRNAPRVCPGHLPASRPI